jgi:hypothetical protein
MAKDFPFVKIPPELSKVIGKATPGTRVFRREGSQKESGHWFDVIMRHMEEGCVSPGGVAMYVPVSRAAFHHRLKNGLLTVFTFYVVEDEKSFFGTTRKRKIRPYVYIPVSECKAWAEELKRRQGIPDEPTTEKEIGDAYEFLLKDPKDKGRKDVVYGKKMTPEEIVELVQIEMRFAAERVLARVLPGKLAEKHRRRLEGTLMKDGKTGKWHWEGIRHERL